MLILHLVIALILSALFFIIYSLSLPDPMNILSGEACDEQGYGGFCTGAVVRLL